MAPSNDEVVPILEELVNSSIRHCQRCPEIAIYQNFKGLHTLDDCRIRLITHAHMHECVDTRNYNGSHACIHWNIYNAAGIHTEVFEDLAARADGCKGKYVVLTMDAMKVKEDLVYNKHTSQIVGYVNLASTEQQLLALEKDNKGTSPVATHVLQFMVRGICMRLDYPISHFATASLSTEQLYPVVWEVIGAVESTGLKVMVVTADGASPNRKFFRMHEDPSGTNVCNGVTYKTTNIYAPEREIFFMSDVSHLMKTARNHALVVPG